MKIKLRRTSPTYRQSRSTADIMHELMIGLIVISLYACIYQGCAYGIQYALKSLGIIIVSEIVGISIEGIWAYQHHQSLKNMFEDSFPYITPMIYALTLPVGTPYYVVIIGAIFATFFGKLVYGGFGCNIFNPALVGRVIVHLSFSAQLTTTLSSGIDTVTSATPATMLSSQRWLLTSKYQYSLIDMITGHHSGALVESAIIAVIIVGIILAKRRVYDYRIALSYLFTIALLSLINGVIFGVNIFANMIVHLCLGGLMFGAIFMATDPITSPTSPLGKILYGISLGFLTMLIRLKANYPEGVLFSILIMNMLTPFIETITLGRTNSHMKKQYILITSVCFIFCLIIVGISISLKGVI